LGRPSKVKTIGDTFKAFRDGSKTLTDSTKNIKRMGGGTGGGLAGGGKGVKAMGGGKGGKGGGNIAMVGFGGGEKGKKNSLAEYVKTGLLNAQAPTGPTNLSSSDVADIAAKQTSFETTGGNRGAKMMEAKPQFAGGVGGAGGGGGGSGGGMGELSSVKVTGEMTVHFDNEAFKDQISSVVVTLIKTPEFAKSVQQMAFGASSGA
jgi:hypothetical protein